MPSTGKGGIVEAGMSARGPVGAVSLHLVRDSESRYSQRTGGSRPSHAWSPERTVLARSRGTSAWALASSTERGPMALLHCPPALAMQTGVAPFVPAEQRTV